jgi:hypothetical protein
VGDGGPQTSPRGTQTLTCWPEKLVTVWQTRSASHAPEAPHAGAQYVSPPNWAQLPPAQSPSLTHAGHATAVSASSVASAAASALVGWSVLELVA